jgi:hypothetical protein
LKFDLRKNGRRKKIATPLCCLEIVCFYRDKYGNKMFLGSVSQELLEFKVNIISNADCESWLKGNISTQRLVDFLNLFGNSNIFHLFYFKVHQLISQIVAHFLAILQ